MFASLTAFNENPFDQSKHQHVLKEFEDHLFHQHDGTSGHHLAHQQPVHHSEHFTPHHVGSHNVHPFSHQIQAAPHSDPHFHHLPQTPHFHHLHQTSHSDPYLHPTLHHDDHTFPHLHHSDPHLSHHNVHFNAPHLQSPINSHPIHAAHTLGHHHNANPFIVHQSGLHAHPEGIFYHQPVDTSHHLQPQHHYQSLPSTEIHQIAELPHHVQPETQEAPASLSMKPIKVIEAHESLKEILADNKPAASNGNRHVTSILEKLRSGSLEEKVKGDEDTSDLLYHRRISKRSLFGLWPVKKKEEKIVEDYHPAVISHEDRWMAGCLMQCVFR